MDGKGSLWNRIDANKEPLFLRVYIARLFENEQIIWLFTFMKLQTVLPQLY